MSQNPANTPETRLSDPNRIPMSVPLPTLSVPEIPGYDLYWFEDRPGRVQRALRAGYTFVDEGEVDLNNKSIGDDASVSGNTDLGTHISVHGSVDERGRSMKQFLMKIPHELWLEDRKIQAASSEAIVATLKRGTVGADRESATEKALRYTKGAENLFIKKRRP